MTTMRELRREQKLKHHQMRRTPPLSKLKRLAKNRQRGAVLGDKRPQLMRRCAASFDFDCVRRDLKGVKIKCRSKKRLTN